MRTRRWAVSAEYELRWQLERVQCCVYAYMDTDSGAERHRHCLFHSAELLSRR